MLSLLPVEEELDLRFSLEKFLKQNRPIIEKIKKDKQLQKIDKRYAYISKKLEETIGTPEHLKWLIQEKKVNKQDIARRIAIKADIWGDLRNLLTARGI